MMDDRKKRQNVTCNLLSHVENNKLIELLGFKCIAMASAVVQVFLTEMKTNHSQWNKRFCGVACFIRDCVQKSYFIRVFSVEKAMCLWEQELYNTFIYKSSCPFFHTFEADNCMAGLNFADNEEANNFEHAVQKIIQDKQQRKMEKRRQQGLQPPQTGLSVPTPKMKSESMPALPTTTKETKSSKKNKKKKKYTKEDISEPMNFVHREHVGWDPEKGFEISAEDPALLGFFSLAGVSEQDLNDNDTRKFIYEFIDTHGGVEVAKQEARLRTKPPPPVRETPSTPQHTPSTRTAPRPPPPPPSHPPAVSRNVGGAPSRPPQPPNAPSPPARVFPNQRPPETAMQTAPPPPPPPPPPPMMMNISGPPPPPTQMNSSGPPLPPPPPMMQESAQQPDGRSALFDQIRKGRTLHHVEVNGSNSNTVSDRGALLTQIRQGIELKPVTVDPRSSSPIPPLNGLAEALARALEERNRAVHHTDDDDSGEEEDENYDDEWED